MQTPSKPSHKQQQQAQTTHSELPEPIAVADQLAKQLGAESDRRLHPSSWLFIVLDNLLRFALPLVVFLFFNPDVNDSPVTKAVVLVLAIVAAFLPIAHFLSYRFALVAGEFRIYWGIINKQQRHIPLKKIHNVAIKQTLLHRLLNVAEVRLESAGSGQESEALLRVLSLADALLIEQAVNTGIMTPKVSLPTPKQMPIPSKQQLMTLNDNEIIRYGLISNAGIVLGSFLTVIISPERIVAWLVSMGVFDVPAELVASGGLIEMANALFASNQLWLKLLSWFAISLAFLLSVVIMGKIYSVVTAYIQYYDFKLSDNGKAISIEKGLLTRQKSHVPIDKIQVWRVEETLLHRCFKRQTLLLDTAILANGKNQTDERGINELVPIATPAQMVMLLNHWQQPQVQQLVFQPVHSKAWRRLFFRWFMLWMLVFIVLVVFMQPWWQVWLALFALAVVFAGVASKQRASFMGVALTHTHLVWRDGWLKKVWYVAQIEHVHAIALIHNPFDRRYGMATLITDTVGGTLFKARLTLPFLPQQLAEQIAQTVMQTCNLQPTKTKIPPPLPMDVHNKVQAILQSNNT